MYLLCIAGAFAITFSFYIRNFWRIGPYKPPGGTPISFLVAVEPYLGGLPASARRWSMAARILALITRSGASGFLSARGVPLNCT